MSIGILTLATTSDYQKAIGLALSARVSNPGVPLAVACLPNVRPLVTPYFDDVIDQDPTLRGFMHKLHLDRYSPFEETFFFDADVLLFRPLNEVISAWREQSYSACGEYVAEGRSSFGLERSRLRELLGVEKLACIDGAGHAYFRKPDCQPVFDRAREVAADYQKYCGNAQFCDEDAIAIAMTMLGVRPMPRVEFWSRPCSGQRTSRVINASTGVCQFELVTFLGREQRPHMMHFAAKEAPFLYLSQLRRLYRKFDVPMKGLLPLAAGDFYTRNIRWPLGTYAKRWAKTLRWRSQEPNRGAVPA